MLHRRCAHARARLDHHNSAEVRFASFFCDGFITAIVVNPLERKLAKHTSVQCGTLPPPPLSILLNPGKTKVLPVYGAAVIY